MKFEWIFLFSILSVVSRCDSVSTVRINVNLDFAISSPLKVYEGLSGVGSCSQFNKIGNSVYLTINKSLQSGFCDGVTVNFYLFVYYHNISSALVTVKNKGNTADILQNFNKYVVLYVTNIYITFVECIGATGSCSYPVPDTMKVVKDNNWEIYSACEDPTVKPCLTSVEFLPQLIHYPNSSSILGTVVNVKRSVLDTKPDFNANCRNGGTRSGTSNNICICPRNENFNYLGPLCEVLQISLSKQQNFYVLPNTDVLIIEFSLFTTANQKPIEIFRIKSPSTEIVYTLTETNHQLRINGVNVTHDMISDTSTWLNIHINISANSSTFRINDKSTRLTIAVNLQLDTIPLALANMKQGDSKLCLANLKVNSQIVDLYVPNYQNCQPNCGECGPETQCESEPFKSKGFARCRCRKDFMKISKNNCTANDDKYTVSIKHNEVTTLSQVSNIDGSFVFIRFEFRTLSNNANLISLKASNPNGYNITVRIVNENIFFLISGTAIVAQDSISYYSVSNGQWHLISMNMTAYSFEISVDEDLPYNSKKIMFNGGSLGFISYQVGPFLNNDLYKTAFTTCFRSFSIVQNDDTELNAPLNASLPFGCSSGLQCSDLACPNNEICSPSWQNTLCVCQPNFVKINGTCIFSGCVTYPCNNGGVCYNNNDKFACNCTEGFSGATCDDVIQKAVIYWWIILIVLLILLMILIIIIVVCICRKKRTDHKKGPDINKIHENTVVYNEPAGEVDYHGPPINYSWFKYGGKPATPETVAIPPKDFKIPKHNLEIHNKDLVIDQPLDYGYEGDKSDIRSVTSIGSRSTDDELNIEPIDKSNDNFKYLKNLYK